MADWYSSGYADSVGNDPWAKKQEQGKLDELKRKEQLGAKLGGYEGAKIGDRGQDRYMGMSDESRGMQGEAAGMMREAALGNAPSVAQNQMQQGLGMSAQNQLAMAAGARGGGLNQAAGMRTAQNVNAQNAANMVGQAAMLRAQEMADARNQYMQAATQQRAQDLMARGMSADEAFRQAGLDLQSQQLRQQGMLSAEDMRHQIFQSQLAADMNRQQLLAGQRAAKMAQAEKDRERAYAITGAVGSGMVAAAERSAAQRK